MKNSVTGYLCLLACLQGIAFTSQIMPALADHAVSAADVGAFSSAQDGFDTTGDTISITNRREVKNLTIPATVRLKIAGEGTIHVANGTTLTINGPFEAPLRRVFTGPGKVVFSLSSIRRVYPEWWGAENGVESATAIQSAIDSLSRGEVFLSARTYLLNRRISMRLVDGSRDAVSAVLVPKSGVSIVGKGYGSVLMVPDGFSAHGDYVVFAPVKAEETSNITFSRFRIDGNGGNNLVRGVSGGLVRRSMAIWLFKGENITVDNVTFENQPGTNVVKLGSDSLSYLVTDSTVSNCVFHNMGGAIPGNRAQSDHSTLYVSGRDVTVSNNRLTNPRPHDENGPPVAVLAGIEMHGDGMTVSGNLVRNYSNGGYIVADGIVTARNQRWIGNRFESMTKLGISIWSVGRVENVLIESNVITLNGDLDQGVSGIFQPPHPPDTTVGIDGIIVRGNAISGRDVKSGTVWNGIQFTSVRNAVIENNLIERISGAGILVYGSSGRKLDSLHVSITGNTIRDTGFNRYGAHPFAIDIYNNGLGRFEDFRISGNMFENNRFLTDGMRGIGVRGTGPIAGLVIDGANSFANFRNKAEWIGVSGPKSGVAVDPSLR